MSLTPTLLIDLHIAYWLSVASWMSHAGTIFLSLPAAQRHQVTQFYRPYLGSWPRTWLLQAHLIACLHENLLAVSSSLPKTLCDNVWLTSSLLMSLHITVGSSCHLGGEPATGGGGGIRIQILCLGTFIHRNWGRPALVVQKKSQGDGSFTDWTWNDPALIVSRKQGWWCAHQKFTLKIYRLPQWIFLAKKEHKENQEMEIRFRNEADPDWSFLFT